MQTIGVSFHWVTAIAAVGTAIAVKISFPSGVALLPKIFSQVSFF